MKILRAELNDLPDILALQKKAFTLPAKIYDNYNIPPLTETLEEMQEIYRTHIFLKAVIDNVIVGSVRAHQKDGNCHIGRLIVDPKYHNKGIGSKLMKAIENTFSNIKRYELNTGYKSERNIYLYKKLGYVIYKEVEIEPAPMILICMEKIISGNTDG